ncbi:MAG: SDR family NAD(P)-dependent oxidoreductase [Candidatus Nanopelagicales bacterium]
MSRVLVTGSAQGLGRAAANQLLTQGHETVVHVRDRTREPAVADLVARGADVVSGDLADLREVRRLADRLDDLGPLDAVIHNAGVIGGPALLHVNVVAPYLLVASMQPANRLIFLSSGMHRGGRADVAGIDWSKGDSRSYSDSKLFITALSCALAREVPQTLSNAVDPGWVPTRMGGPSAPDDLALGHETQVWLATSDDADARTTGGYWYHRQRRQPHPAAHDERFQSQLLASLAEWTGQAIT